MSDTPQRDTREARAEAERANLDTVCHHLALVAIDGATDEVADTLGTGFVLHLDDIDTDATGYLALIEANHAAHPSRPPLDVLTAHAVRQFVTTTLEPRCLARFRVDGGRLAELWMTVDWNSWADGVITPIR